MQSRTGSKDQTCLPVKTCLISSGDQLHKLDKTQVVEDKCLNAVAVTCIYRQVRLGCTVVASGFIGMSQRLNGTPGLSSLFHTKPVLKGGVKQSMKLI